MSFPRLATSLCLSFAFAATASAQATKDQVDRYQDRAGTEVEVHSGVEGRKPDGKAPSFASLDRNGDKMIDSHEAADYRLLGDDFKFADSNHDGSVSADEYARWTAQR